MCVFIFHANHVTFFTRASTSKWGPLMALILTPSGDMSVNAPFFFNSISLLTWPIKIIVANM